MEYTPEQTEAGQIQAEYSSKFGQISERLETIKASVRTDASYSDEERLDLIHDACEQADLEHARAASERNARLAERERELREDLFGAPSGSAGPAFTNALLQAHGADDEHLRTLADLAAKTGDKTLGKAVFAVAHERNLADVALPYLNSNREAMAAYREFGTMPTPEERERAVGFSFPRPNLQALRPQGQDAAAAQRVETLRRMEYAKRAIGSG